MKDELTAKLEAKSQGQVLRFWDELSSPQRSQLAQQIEAVDLDLIAALYASRSEASDAAQLAERAGQPPSFRLGDERNQIQPVGAIARGTEAIAAGEVASIVVAGGQGTRLGFPHPKGMFPIGPVSGATLFQIHCEKVLALGRKYGVRIPLCVMTSPATHEETARFLEEHERFGLQADDVMVFCQGTMPAVDARTGRLLLADKDRLALSPDGHGGMLHALDRSGILAELEARGIRHLFYFQIDNPLVDVASAELLGYHTLSGSELTSEVVRKQDPRDRVGNVIEVDGRLRVIEYSDLPDEVARQRADDGSLKIWAGSIAIHVMDVDFLRRMAGKAEALPFHFAKKKVAHIGSDGTKVEPTEPNAIKFERFIFDLLPSAENAIVVEVDPREHFAPLKNAPGAAGDTAATVQAQMIDLHRRWLVEAGAQVADHAPVEISPLFAVDASEAKRKIEPGVRISEATYLR